MNVGGSLDAGTIEVKKNVTISNTTVVGNVFAGVGVRSAQGFTGGKRSACVCCVLRPVLCSDCMMPPRNWRSVPTDDLAAASAIAGGTISAAGHIITSGMVVLLGCGER